MNGVVATVSGVVAVVSLFLTAVSLLAAPAGGIIFTPFLFGLFLLALVGVFSGGRGPHRARAQPRPRWNEVAHWSARHGRS